MSTRFDDHNLFVIEASGKIGRLREILRDLGVRSPNIIATGGHILCTPKSLSPVGLDAHLRETIRQPRDGEKVASLIDRTRGRSVHILTDRDPEGDAIALDVAMIARHAGATAILRHPLSSLTEEAVCEALGASEPVDVLRAAPARARAIVDRLIGGTCSGDNVSVGRISSALLGVLARESASETLSAGKAVLSLRATRGRPFRMEVEVRGPDEAADLQARLDAIPPVPPIRRIKPPASPAHMGHLMMYAWDELGFEPNESENLIQRLYEGGRMSYPRSASFHMGAHGQHVAAEMARLARLSWGWGGEEEGGCHEVPHLLRPVDPTLDTDMLSRVDAMEVLVARRVVLAGSPVRVECPDPEALPDWAQGLPLRRPVTRQATMAWSAEPGRPDGYHPYSPARLALGLMVAHELGQPSTWASHSMRFATRSDLLEMEGPRLTISAKGRYWMAGTPPALLETAFQRSVDQAVEAAWQALVKDAGRRTMAVTPLASGVGPSASDAGVAQAGGRHGGARGSDGGAGTASGGRLGGSSAGSGVTGPAARSLQAVMADVLAEDFRNARLWSGFATKMVTRNAAWLLDDHVSVCEQRASSDIRRERKARLHGFVREEPDNAYATQLRSARAAEVVATT
jgi:DNA topoisomerase-1